MLATTVGNDVATKSSGSHGRSQPHTDPVQAQAEHNGQSGLPHWALNLPTSASDPAPFGATSVPTINQRPNPSSHTMAFPNTDDFDPSMNGFESPLFSGSPSPELVLIPSPRGVVPAIGLGQVEGNIECGFHPTSV